MLPLGSEDKYLAIKTCSDLLLGMGNAKIEDSDYFKEDCLNALLSLVDDDLNEILCHLQLALNKRNNHDQSVLKCAAHKPYPSICSLNVVTASFVPW